MSLALLADIGGTNARFALLDNGVRLPVMRLATRDFDDLGPALAHALATLGAERVDEVAVCAAGPPRDGAITLTNCPWQVSIAALRTATGVAHPILVNDFTALAAALPALAATDLERIGDGTPVAGEPRAVIGPGTGLGVSAWLPGGALISGEGGHVDLAASNAGEDRVLARLRERFGHVSAERVLSGPGLTHLYAAMHSHAAPGQAPAPASITAAARGGDARALACIEQFCAFLGAVSGDVALTLGARGGVFLGGGIVPAWGVLFDRDAFRARFENKGRYREYLRAIPTDIISVPDPALIGLARLLAGG